MSVVDTRHWANWPELPPGYYIEVWKDRTERGEIFLLLTAKKKRWWWFDRTVDSTCITIGPEIPRQFSVSGFELAHKINHALGSLRYQASIDLTGR